MAAIGFPTEMILVIFDLQVTPMCLPSKLAFLFKRKKQKIDFQDGGHLGFPIGRILATFDLQVTPMLPTKFPVSWPFGSGEEAKNKFLRWLPRWRSWISESNNFAIFDLQVTLILPTKFQVHWPRGVGGVGF